LQVMRQHAFTVHTAGSDGFRSWASQQEKKKLRSDPTNTVIETMIKLYSTIHYSEDI